MTSPAAAGARLARTCALVVVASAMAITSVVSLVGPAHPVTASRAAADRDCAPANAPPTRVPGPRLAAVPVARADEPTSVALWRGTPDGVLAERPGRLRAIRDGEVTDEVVLDLTDDTAHEGDGGLLAARYDPTGTWLYLLRTTAAMDDVLTAHGVDGRGRPVAEPGRELLRVDRGPSEQHHGGGLVVADDGVLYVGLGDGGGLGDPRENAQDRASLLGKVLRIEPTPAARRPYRIPDDNPFVDRHGWRPEIWALGLRNPYRMALAADGSALWVGDVGQSCWEELDLVRRGDNLGWDRREGWEPFESGDVPGGTVGPVLARSHGAGWCAIVVSDTVDGPVIPELAGLLLVTDHCTGRVLGLDVRTAPAAASPDVAPDLLDLGVRVDAPTAIVRGPRGRPWVLTLEGLVLELSGP